MDGCLKLLICLVTPPLGWIYLLWEGFEHFGNQVKIQEQKNYFNLINPKTKEDLQKIDTMDGHTFEHYVAHILSKNGYYNVSVTSGSNDFGVDIIAHKNANKYAIQVKRQANRVSRRAVSDAVAGKDHYRCNYSMVITNNYMTDGGMRLALTTNCIIIDREKLISLIETGNVSNGSKEEDAWEEIVVEQDIIKENDENRGTKDNSAGLHCPKCNCDIVINQTECLRCGIIFEKYEAYIQKKIKNKKI